MLEKYIQRRLKKLLLKGGWRKVLKFESPSEDSYPDLICLAKPELVCWIEVKVPGEQPTIKQAYRHKELREMGFKVFTVHSEKAALTLTPDFVKNYKGDGSQLVLPFAA